MNSQSSLADATLYVGDVVHKRLRPKPHALAYRVFSLLVDVDRIDAAAAASRFFSYNRLNLVSLHDRDHGAGEGTTIAAHAREVLRRAGHADADGRIMLLCYPRVLGYVFNPLSVYYAHDRAGRLRALVYEVNNTFGERTSYVLGAGRPTGGTFAQSCVKRMHVSPFADPAGRYSFHVTAPGEDLVLGVAFRDQEGPLIKTHFKGSARAFDDATLLRLLIRIPFLTLKVIAAIHLEALKLWLKGVPVVQGTTSPRYSVIDASKVDRV